MNEIENVIKIQHFQFLCLTDKMLYCKKKNAFNYARAGACSVVEEMNMTANILSSEIERLTGDKTIYDTMARNAKTFGKHDAAMKIARALMDITLSHESR